MLRGVWRAVIWAFWRPILFWAVFTPFVMLAIFAHFLEGGLAARISGFLSQVVGYIMVALGLRGVVRELVDAGVRSTIMGWVREWWNDRPFRRRNVVMTAAGSSLSVGVATAHLRADMAEGVPLEDRVTYLEGAVELLRKEHGELMGAVRAGMKDLGDKLIEEEKRRLEAEAALIKRIKGAFVDGIGFDLVGIWLFIAGNAIGTFAQEVVAWSWWR